MFSRKKKLSDQQLIDGILKGGSTRERCIAAIYDANIGFVYKLQQKQSLEEDEARMAYADAVVTLSEQIASQKFRGDSKISTYLYRIFFNKCVDVNRKKSSNRITTTDEFPVLAEDSKNMQELLELGDEVKQLHGILDRIGEKCKQILIDWGYHGYTMDEIAERAGLKNAESAISQKYKCFTKLKKELKGLKKSI